MASTQVGGQLSTVHSVVDPSLWVLADETRIRIHLHTIGFKEQGLSLESSMSSARTGSSHVGKKGQKTLGQIRGSHMESEQKVIAR